MKDGDGRDTRRIVGGFLFILALAVVVFGILARFLDSRTERDVSRIAQTYLEYISREELSRFTMFAYFRYSQMDRMIDHLDELGDEAAAEEIVRLAEEIATFQDVLSCALVEEDGTVHMICGDRILSIEDEESLISRLKNGERAVSCGYTDVEHVILWAVPGVFPVEGGGTSVGILYGRSMETFAEKMNLHDNHDNSALRYFHLIRRDGSCLYNDSETPDEQFLTSILLYSEPRGMTAEEAVSLLLDRIENGDSFTLSLHYDYTDENGRIHDNRGVLGLPVPGSDWYLVTILPYGVLDKTIESMGTSRLIGILLAVGVLSLGTLWVTVQYLRMMRRQITALDGALVTAEAAREQADHACEDAEAAREQADRAREDAEAANLAKSEFLSNMSHDIRTPMNAIIGMTTIAAAHVEDPERVRDCLRKITLSGKQLLGLINDVLDMSKIESGKLSIHPEALSLRESMETAEGIIRPQTDAKDQHFEVIIRDLYADNVLCDSVRLNQILLNLLSNAMKYTQRGGRITASLWQEDSLKGREYVCTHFLVQDNGIGMTEEFQRTIFTAFTREDRRRVQKTEGAGLGMAITKYIIDAMGGSILLRSEPGRGSAFHVTLDLERAARKNQPEDADEPGTPESGVHSGNGADGTDSGNGVHSVDSTDSGNGIHGVDSADGADGTDGADGVHSAGDSDGVDGTEEEQGQGIEGARILLAEDNDLNAEIAATLLEEYGAEVDHAEDGMAALKLFEKSSPHHYQIILMDLRMPNMNGFEAAEAIRQLRRSDAAAIPIIAMSADAFAEDVERCYAAGMNGHVAKPIDMDILLKTLVKHLRSS